MKRIISIICVFAICISIFGTLAFAEAISGDISGDGVLDIVDVAFTRAYIIGSAQFTKEQTAIADMNNDKNVDVIDVVMMRKIIVDGGGSKFDESGITLSSQKLVLNKGASALVYVETENTEKLMMNYKSDLFEAVWTSDNETGKIGIAIFVKDNADSEVVDKIDVYLEGNETNVKSIIVTVTAKNEVSGYVNNYEVPDFGTFCGFPAVMISADGNYYAYSVNEMLTKYTEEEVKNLYVDFQAILEMFGFELQFIYTGTTNGEVQHFVNDTKTIGVDYGVVELEDGEHIILSVSRISEVEE